MFQRLVQKVKSRAKKALAGVVVGLIIAVVAIIIGAVIVAQLWNVVTSMGLTGPANTTVTNLFTQVWNAFGLFIIVPIIIVAGVIISMLLGWGRATGGR